MTFLENNNLQIKLIRKQSKYYSGNIRRCLKTTGLK